MQTTSHSENGIFACVGVVIMAQSTWDFCAGLIGLRQSEASIIPIVYGVTMKRRTQTTRDRERETVTEQGKQTK